MENQDEIKSLHFFNHFTFIEKFSNEATRVTCNRCCKMQFAFYFIWKKYFVDLKKFVNANFVEQSKAKQLGWLSCFQWLQYPREGTILVWMDGWMGTRVWWWSHNYIPSLAEPHTRHHQHSVKISFLTQTHAREIYGDLRLTFDGIFIICTFDESWKIYNVPPMSR